MTDKQRKFRLQDLSEVIMGSVLLAFPVAITEEVWNMGAKISTLNAILISIVSVLHIAWFVYHAFYQSGIDSTWKGLVIRTFVTYFVTLIVAALILAIFDQFPLMTDALVAIKRMIIVALPASFCATVINSLR